MVCVGKLVSDILLGVRENILTNLAMNFIGLHGCNSEISRKVVTINQCPLAISICW